MSVSYKKLWKLLSDKDMKKKTCVKRRVSLLSGGDDAKLTNFAQRFDTETQLE